MSSHSKVGASSAARWKACPGSVQLLQDHPMPPNRKAADGTRTHALAEALLNYRLESNTVGDAYEQLILEQHDEDRQARALLYVDHVWSTYTRLQRQGKNPVLHVELTGNLPALHESAFGTIDAGIFCKNGPFYVIDLKDGEWDVSPEENTQLMYYMAVLMHHAGVDCVPTSLHLQIVQPKNGGVKKWTCSRKKVDSLVEELHEAAKLVFAENPKRIPGPQCEMFCNRPHCPEFNAYHKKKSNIDFDPIEPVCESNAPDVNSLSVEQLCNILKAQDYINAIASDAQKLLFHRGLNGQDMGDYKLVRGTGRYQLTASVETLADSLKLSVDDLYEDRKAKSKSAIEKLIGQKYSDKKTKKEKLDILLNNCTRPEGEIKFVHSTAKGEPYTPDLTNFDNLED